MYTSFIYVESVQIIVFTDILVSEIQALATIIKHEVGHALGLGHTNFKGDLMSPEVNDQAQNITNCDIEGVEKLVILSVNGYSLKADLSEGFGKS